MMEERIAKITRADIGVEDHGILTTFVTFEYGGGSCQGLPGYCLDGPVRDADDKFIGRYGTAYGMEFVRRIMRAAGVDRWSEVKGRTVLALIGPDSMVAGIKPLPTEPGEEFVLAKLREEIEALADIAQVADTHGTLV